MGFPDRSFGKEFTCNAGDPGFIPGSGRSPGERIGYPLQYSWASLVAQLVKKLPAMQETWIRSLSWENPLEKGKSTHSSGEFHGLYSPWGHKELDTTERLSLSLCCVSHLLVSPSLSCTPSPPHPTSPSVYLFLIHPFTCAPLIHLPVHPPILPSTQQYQ